MQNVANTIKEWIASEYAEQPLLLVSSSEKIIIDFFDIAKSAFAKTDAEKKQILSHNHPDVFTIEGENNRIYIKHIEAIKPLLVHRAKKRLVLIPRADTILSEAASALLKTFEEPSVATRFLLGAKSKRGILPTIRSRCRIVFAGSTIIEELPMDTDEALTRLSSMRKPEPFSEEDLTDIAQLIHILATDGEVTPALIQTSIRLKEYYKIAAIPGGNAKLAADILLASLAQLRNTISI